LVHTGTVLAGRYRLERRVGSGGMGEVWRAFDRVLDRTVAVKCLLAAPADEPTFVDRFRAEARIMATISHPSVVEVYDFGDDPTAGVYLVMKYIEGESLAHTLARTGRLDAAGTMRMVADAAEALHAAHERGVTHRDVKPGNLLLRPDGSALLTDFGIARSSGAVGHTTTGSLVGTAAYMSPERANGRPAEPPSDIYSLGVVAYRCLTGRLPFPGDNAVEIALRHIQEAPAPLPPDLPPAVRAVVERAMAKEPADRWPTAAVLAQQARRALDPPEDETTARVRMPQQRPVPGGQRPVRAEGGPVPAERGPALADRGPAPGGRGTGGRLGRGLLVAGVAVLLVVTVATAVIALSRRGGQQPRSLGQSPGAGTTLAGDPGAADPAVGPGAMAALPSASVAAGPSLASSLPGAAARTALPAPPANLTATPISAHAIRLRWTDRSANEGGFTVINGITSRNVGANTTTFDWTGMSPATYSCFKVRAYNAYGASAYAPAAQTSWACATTQDGIGPAAPTNLNATAISTGTIRLQWTDNSSNEDGFTVINGNTSRSAGANATTFDWTGLAPGTYMCFKVRAFNSAGVSGYSPAAQGAWACLTTPAS
jgi:eukaryotic-like serine/threonine-protein kinase